MLKIVFALNGFSVRQSVTALGIELQLQLKIFYFSKKNFIIFHKKLKLKIKLFFGKKWFFGWFFWSYFAKNNLRKTTYKISYFLKKYFFFVFWKKWKKYIFCLNFFWSSSAEDDLWKTIWQIISLPCTSLMLVLPQYNFYFYSSKL